MTKTTTKAKTTATTKAKTTATAKAKAETTAKLKRKQMRKIEKPSKISQLISDSSKIFLGAAIAIAMTVSIGHCSRRPAGSIIDLVGDLQKFGGVQERVPKKTKNPQKKIRVWYTAYLSCQEWCRGQCKYVEVDPNQDYLYRYSCKGDKNGK